MNVRCYDDAISSFHDDCPGMIRKECISLQKAIQSLACARCGIGIARESIMRVKPAPSAQWSELCEELYCEHGGSVHMHKGMVASRTRPL